MSDAQNNDTREQVAEASLGKPEDFTIHTLIERFGDKEVLEALGLAQPTRQSTAMARAVDYLNLHMDAITAIYNTHVTSDEAAAKADRLVGWHSKQADPLVAELRRLGYGDGSSISVRRRSALLRWHAEFEPDADEILSLLQAEEALHRRTTLPDDHPLRKPNYKWTDDFRAGLAVSDAANEEKRAAALEIEEERKEMARFLAAMGDPN